MGELAVGFFSGTVGVFDTSDGSLKWENTYLDGENMGRGNSKISIDSDGNTYFGGFWEEDSWDGVTEHNVLVKYNSGGAKAWEKSGNFIIAELGPNEDYLYTGTYDTQTLHKVDVTDGSSVWTYSGPFDSGVYGVAVTDNGYVYVHDYNGNNAKLDTAGNEQFTNSLPFGNYPRIISEDGYLYWRGNKYDPADGQNMTAIWSSEAAEYLKYESGYLYGEGSNGGFVKVDAGDGSTVWVDSNVSSFRYGVGADSNGDFYYSDNNNFYKRSGSNKTQIWSNTNYGYPKSMMVRPVSNTAPTADYTYTKNGGTVDFTDQSSDSDGSIASYSWDFGDGTTSTSQSPSHTYSSSGTYTATLTVTDDAGATASTSQDVSVTTSISGTAALTDKGQTTSSAGTVANAGSAATTDKGTTLSLTGGLPLSTSLSLTSKKESLSLAGGPVAGGTAAFTDAGIMIQGEQKPITGTPAVVFTDRENPNEIYRVDAANGSIQWTRGIYDATGADTVYINDVTAGRDGKVYTVVDDYSGSAYVGARIIQHGPDGSRISSKPSYPSKERSFQGVKPLPSADSVIVHAEDIEAGANGVYLIRFDNDANGLVRGTTVTVGTSNRIEEITIDDDDGKVFVVMEADGVYAYDSQLSFLWHNANPFAQDAATTSDALYASGNTLYRMDKTSGTVEWSEDTDTDELAAVGFDNEIFATDSYQYARYEDTGSGLSQTWVRDWYFSSSFPDDILADKTRSVFVGGSQGGTSDAHLERAAPDGTLRYSTGFNDPADTFDIQRMQPLLRGRLSLTTDGKETVTGSALVTASAEAAVTDKGQSFAFTSTGPAVGGSSAFTDAPPHVAAEGVTALAINLSITDKAQSTSTAGKAIAAGTHALTDDKQSLALGGSVNVNGTSAFTDAISDVGVDGGPLASSTLSLTGSKEGLSLSGGLTAGGSLGLTDQPLALALVGSALASGTGALTSKQESLAFTAGVLAGGSLGLTDQGQTLALVGSPITAGSLSATDAGQALSNTGVVLLGGTSSITSSGPAFTLTGNVALVGSGGFTSKKESLAFTVNLYAGGKGALSFTDAETQLAAEGGPTTSGGGSYTDKQSNVQLTGALPLTTTLSIEDKRSAHSFGAQVLVGGSLTAVDAGQMLAAEGGPVAGGSGGVTDQGQTLALVGDLLASGSGALTSKGEKLRLYGIPVLRTSLSLTDEAEAAQAGGEVLASGDMSASGAPSVISSTGGPVASGTAQAASQPPQIALLGGPVAGGSGGLVDTVQTLALVGTPVAGGGLEVDSDGEALSSQGTVLTSGQGSVNDELIVLLTASGQILTAGTLSATDAKPALALQAFVGREPATTRVQITDNVSLSGSIGDTISLRSSIVDG